MSTSSGRMTTSTGYLMDGGIITVNTETAAELGIDPAVFADMGELVEVGTTKE